MRKLLNFILILIVSFLIYQNNVILAASTDKQAKKIDKLCNKIDELITNNKTIENTLDFLQTILENKNKFPEFNNVKIKTSYISFYKFENKLIKVRIDCKVDSLGYLSKNIYFKDLKILKSSSFSPYPGVKSVNLHYYEDGNPIVNKIYEKCDVDTQGDNFYKVLSKKIEEMSYSTVISINEPKVNPSAYKRYWYFSVGIFTFDLPAKYEWRYSWDPVNKVGVLNSTNSDIKIDIESTTYTHLFVMQIYLDSLGKIYDKNYFVKWTRIQPGGMRGLRAVYTKNVNKIEMECIDYYIHTAVGIIYKFSLINTKEKNKIILPDLNFLFDKIRPIDVEDQ